MQISRIEKVDASTSGPAMSSRSSKPATSLSSAAKALADASFPSAVVHGSPDSVHLPLLTASYSTTVAGKTYSLSVEESGGTYVASVPNPPGASATGSSPQSAENNLDIKLDILT